eukprot:5886332-Amphidinium_carterae.1
MSAWGKQERKADSDGMKSARKRVSGAGGPKASVKGLVDITMTCIHKSKETSEAGYLRPGQVAEKATVLLSCYSGDLNAWQRSLEMVITKNQEQHKA